MSIPGSKYYPGSNVSETGDNRMVEAYCRIIGVEMMIDLLWAHVLDQADHPLEEAESLKETILDHLRHDPASPEFSQLLEDVLETRLDAVIERLSHFHQR